VPFADSSAAAMPTTAGLKAIRGRWRHSRHGPAILRICVLAGYPIGPLVPYLGVGLTDAGLRPAVRVGLPDEGLATFRPDVLVVAPRLERRRRYDPRRALLAASDTALATSERLGCLLVLILPAVPQRWPVRVPGDTGTHASAVRDHVRARPAGLPRVCVVDAEEAVGGVNGRRFRLGTSRYSEEVFAHLARLVVRALRIHYGMTWRVVVIDADSLLLPTADPHATMKALGDPLQALHRSGVQIALRAGPTCDGVWDILAEDFPDLVSRMVDGSIVDERPVDVQLRAIATDADVSADQTVLLTANPDLVAMMADGLGHPRVLLLSGAPAEWPTVLREAGLVDRPF
jgi:hypothetical protein